MVHIAHLKTVPEPIGSFWKYAMLDRKDPAFERQADPAAGV
jgi:hypothetical protein